MVNLNIELDNKTILVTGSPGFVGANLCCGCSESSPAARWSAWTT
jgi:FlaA1/EpsC-like NDP-sugar epimerase